MSNNDVPRWASEDFMPIKRYLLFAGGEYSPPMTLLPPFGDWIDVGSAIGDFVGQFDDIDEARALLRRDTTKSLVGAIAAHLYINNPALTFDIATESIDPEVTIEHMESVESYREAIDGYFDRNWALIIDHEKMQHCPTMIARFDKKLAAE